MSSSTGFSSCSTSFSLPASREDLLVDDPIYGHILLGAASPDAVLIDLIQSPGFQRLKGVLQHGVSALRSVQRCGAEPPVTRYDHSIGAAMLVRNLGAGMEEQVAALLHDVAHTSLSHVIDYVFGRVVHEEDKLEFLSSKTNIPAILHAHGYDSSRVLDEANYSLLERQSPQLCADRVDYGLRDTLAFGILTQEQSHSILRDLADFEGEIVCRSRQSALLLSEAYMKADAFAWGNAAHAALYRYAAEAIAEAFRLDLLTKDDLWASEGSDEDFWRQLVESPSQEVRRLVARVRGSLNATEVASQDAGEEVLQLSLKTRTLDPSVLVDGATRRLSELDSDYAEKLEAYKACKRGARWFCIAYDE